MKVPPFKPSRTGSILCPAVETMRLVIRTTDYLNDLEHPVLCLDDIDPATMLHGNTFAQTTLWQSGLHDELLEDLKRS